MVRDVCDPLHLSLAWDLGTGGEIYADGENRRYVHIRWN